MQTLDAPVYEVKQNSNWYKNKLKSRNDKSEFFDKFKVEFGTAEGFAYWTSSYFGVAPNSPCYNLFKSDLLKNPKDGYYPISKRSKKYKLIKEMLEHVEEVSPFIPHDVFGLNNVNNSHWVDDRWFFSVKNADRIEKFDEIESVDYKKYLQLVIDNTDK